MSPGRSVRPCGVGADDDHSEQAPSLQSGAEHWGRDDSGMIRAEVGSPIAPSMIATCLRFSQALRLPVVLLLAAIAVGIASLTDGESTGHAFSHLIPAAVATIVAGVAARFWRVRPTRLDRFARRALVGALSFFAAAQILEAVGAFAGSGRRDCSLRAAADAPRCRARPFDAHLSPRRAVCRRCAGGARCESRQPQPRHGRQVARFGLRNVRFCPLVRPLRAPQAVRAAHDEPVKRIAQ